MNKLLIFAGTGDGRRLAEILHRHRIDLHVCVATRYGEDVMPEELEGRVTRGRLSAEEMAEKIREGHFTEVIDATHPYAVAVSRHIREACEETGVPCLRLVRPRAEDDLTAGRDCVRAGSVAEAAEILKNTAGRVLVATGSKELAAFTAVPDYRERLIARVLPDEEVLAECRRIGFSGKNVIAMQGPFTEELNTALLRQTGASWLVTKESGREGGFPEKLRAARRAGARVIVIERPEEESGFSFAELVERYCPAAVSEIREPEAIPVDPRRITLLGIGMGAMEQLTYEGIQACQEADVIIGAKRMLAALASFEKPVFESWKSEEILSFIHRHPEYHRVVIALSGDIGFFSGAKKLLEGMETDRVELICGIPSVAYFCSRLKMPWEDVYLLSLHGRGANLAAAIRGHRKVFSLVGGGDSLRDVCRQLTDFGLGGVRLWIGQDLSYPEEKIWEGTVESLQDTEPGSLCVVLFENPEAEHLVVTHGIPDEAFIRDSVPMTKEEIREISVSKLHLTRDAVVYDIGAGTGSISVEAARQAPEGLVLAVEKKPQAVELINRNARRFGVTNLEVIAGEAPEALSDLPVPTHAFIGGTCGRFAEICDLLRMKNPRIRIVVNAVSLETISAVTSYLKEHTPLHLDVVQIAAAKAKQLGEFHLLTGMNPVMIASFDDDGDHNEEELR